MPAGPARRRSTRSATIDPGDVRQLISAGANVNVADKQGLTPLMHAAVVKLLLAERAMVDLPDDEGDRALRHAAVAGQAEVVVPLIAAGADIDATTSIRQQLLGTLRLGPSFD